MCYPGGKLDDHVDITVLSLSLYLHKICQSTHIVVKLRSAVVGKCSTQSTLGQMHICVSNHLNSSPFLQSWDSFPLLREIQTPNSIGTCLVWWRDFYTSLLVWAVGKKEILLAGCDCFIFSCHGFKSEINAEICYYDFLDQMLELDISKKLPLRGRNTDSVTGILVELKLSILHSVLVLQGLFLEFNAHLK